MPASGLSLHLSNSAYIIVIKSISLRLETTMIYERTLFRDLSRSSDLASNPAPCHAMSICFPAIFLYPLSHQADRNVRSRMAGTILRSSATPSLAGQARHLLAMHPSQSTPGLMYAADAEGHSGPIYFSTERQGPCCHFSSVTRCCCADRARQGAVGIYGISNLHIFYGIIGTTTPPFVGKLGDQIRASYSLQPHDI